MRFAKAAPKVLLFLSLAIVPGVFTRAADAQDVGAKTNPDEATKKLLLGKWKSEIAVIEFFANGGIKINDDEYIYKVKGPVITVSNLEGSMRFPYELDGDTLTVDVEGRPVVYTRLKGKATAAGAIGGSMNEGSIIPEFVGKWCYMSSMTGSNSYMSSRCFTLYQNGTYEYSAESSTGGAYGSTAGQSYDSGRWSATRTTLTAYSNSRGKVVYPIELRNHPKTGDAMIVVDGDAYVTATQRRPW
jgi:hypothetical protein